MRSKIALVLVLAFAVAAIPALAGCEQDHATETKSVESAGTKPCPHAAKDAGAAAGTKPCPHAAKDAGAAAGTKPCPHAAKAAEAAGGTAGATEKHECGCPWGQQRKVAEALTAKMVKKVTLTGTVVCGMCDLGKTEACTPMFKSADGTLYTLFMNETAARIKSAHTEGEEKKSVTVTGRVATVGETLWLGLDSFKL